MIPQQARVFPEEYRLPLEALGYGLGALLSLATAAIGIPSCAVLASRCIHFCNGWCGTTNLVDHNNLSIAALIFVSLGVAGWGVARWVGVGAGLARLALIAQVTAWVTAHVFLSCVVRL